VFYKSENNFQLEKIMKIDARTRYTNMVIKNSFFQLLKEKPINKITVKSICELSEINRATFYRYYSDPYDLLKQIQAELILELQKLIEKNSLENAADIIIAILNKMRENSELYMILFSEHGDSTFITQILSLSYQTSQSNRESMLPNIPKAQQEWFYYFFAQGCSSILDRWVRGGMREEPAEVSQFIQRVNRTLLKEFG